MYNTRVSINEKIIKYGSCILVLVAPLIVWGNRIYPHISSKTFFFYGMVEIIFFTWIYTAITDRSYRIPKKVWFYFIPAVVFIAWLTIAGILAKSPELAFWSSFGRGTGLITLYHCFALSLVITAFIKRNGVTYMTTLMGWFIGGATALAVSIWMSTDGFRLQIKALTLGGGGGLMANSSLAAMYELFALAFAVFLLAQKETTKRAKRFIWIAIAIIIFSPLFINIIGLFNGAGLIGSARAAVISLPVALGVFGIFYLFFSPEKKIRFLGTLGILVGIALATIVWIQFTNPDTKIHQKFSEQATGTRFLFWQSAQDAIDKSPIIGYGPENYMVAFQENFKPALLLKENSTEGWNDRAHNIYYETGVSGGYPAILFYAIFLLSIFYAMYRGWRDGKISRITGSIFSALLLGYIFQNLFAFDSTFSLMALFIVAGFVFAVQKNKENENKTQLNLSQYKHSILILGIVALFVFTWVHMVYKPVKKAKLFGEVMSSSIKERPGRYKELLINPPIGDQWDVSQLAFNAYKTYASNPKKIKDDKALVPFAVTDLEAMLEYLEKVSEKNKIDYRLYVTKVYLYNTVIYLDNRKPNDEIFNKVTAALKQAKLLSPTNPNMYWATAQVKVWQGDFKGAEQAYRDALEFFPSLPASNTLFIKFAQAIGDQKLFNEALAEAQKNIPGYQFK